MTKSDKIRLFYGIYLAGFTILLGFLFISEAADLYYSGVTETAVTGMYSREVVGERLLALLPCSVLYCLAAVAGAVLFSVYPAGECRRKPSSADAFFKTKERIPRSREGEYGKLYADFAAKERVRLAVRLAAAAVCILAAVMSAVFLFDAARFPGEDVTGEVLAMLRNILPWVGSAFVACIAATVFELCYARRMLPAVRKLLAAGRGIPSEPSRFGKMRTRAEEILGSTAVKFAVRGALLAIAVAFITVGALNGEAQIVLAKAINICTECIGLG